MSKNKKNREKKGSHAGEGLFIKFFALASTVVVLAIFIGGSLQIGMFAESNRNKTVKILEQSLNTVSVAAENIIGNGDINALNVEQRQNFSKMLYEISAGLDSSVFLCDADGNVLLGSSTYHVIGGEEIDRGVYDRFERDAIPENIARTVGLSVGICDQTTEYSSIYETVDCCFGKAVRDSEGHITALVMLIAPRGVLSDNFYDTVKTFVVSAFVALGVVFIGIYLITYRLLRPIRDMSKAVYRFAEGDYSYRVKVTTDDELGELGNAFNSMASEIANSEHSRRHFVANVSHEFKTPMTTIAGFVDGILDGSIPTDKGKEYLLLVSDEVRRLTKLITILLNLSRIESGDLQLKKRSYDISEQLFTIALSFEQLIENKGIEVLGLDEVEKTIVNADYDLMYQVIYNLVDNAVKFTESDGIIWFGLRAENDRAYFTIRNSGDGIPPRDMPMVFDRFYKVDKSRGLNAKSTGLGLFLVRSIVEMHGGEVSVKSEVGEFCEFSFWIPLV